MGAAGLTMLIITSIRRGCIDSEQGPSKAPNLGLVLADGMLPLSSATRTSLPKIS